MNQKLTAWWNVDFAGFMAEVRKVFKREIPLRRHDNWEEWLASRRAEHEQRAAERPAGDATQPRVYVLFDLSAAEIKIVEESTKYRYGEV